MKWLYILLSAYFGISLLASAQTACPTGVAAGSAQCGPSPSSHSINPASSVPEIRYVPTGKWITTWGAIALSSVGTGEVGTTIGKLSKKEAEKDALSKCEGISGSACAISLSYDNQCSAIAWPPTDHANPKGIPAITAGPSLEEVAHRALKSCNKLSRSGECRIIYSECTEPVFERF
jgi:Domain of unknown function (DUF4189)